MGRGRLLLVVALGSLAGRCAHLSGGCAVFGSDDAVYWLEQPWNVSASGNAGSTEPTVVKKRVGDDTTLIQPRGLAERGERLHFGTDHMLASIAK